MEKEGVRSAPMAYVDDAWVRPNLISFNFKIHTASYFTARTPLLLIHPLGPKQFSDGLGPNFFS